MKTSTIILALAGALTAAAQVLPDSLPECAKTCGQNMLGQWNYTIFNCTNDTDFKCLCSNPNFGYGIHDCSLSVCQSDLNSAQEAINWGIKFCKDNGVDINPPSATVPGHGDATATPPAGGAGAGASQSVVSTSLFTSTFTSTAGSTTITGTTTGTSEILGYSGIPGASPPSTTVATSTITSVTTPSASGSDALTTTSPDSATGDASPTSGAPSAATDSTSTSSALAAQKTAAPAIGFLAAAGLAVAFL